jgi:hypothetical protein
LKKCFIILKQNKKKMHGANAGLTMAPTAMALLLQRGWEKFRQQRELSSNFMIS